MAAPKSFKKNKPNEILAGTIQEPKPKNEPKEVPQTTVVEKVQQKTQEHAVNKEKKKQKYLRLDITEYQDYIALMAEHLKNTSGKYVSMTQYIQRLIEADKQRNIELFEKLENIEKMKREII